MKTDKTIGFREKAEIIVKIDSRAEARGLDRSSFLRQTIREKLAKDSR